MSQTYAPGQRVRVTHVIPRPPRDGGGDVVQATEGTVVGGGPAKTGSWFAHAKDHKLWLQRLVLRKDNGELVHINLDPNTTIDLVEPGR